jgi:uncharacterized cysteine cluster protein YcgN (CxxCxxCC family)
MHLGRRSGKIFSLAVVEPTRLNDSNDRSRPFWEITPLAALTLDQWESLCDGCGKCCLEKFEDEDSGDIVYSRVACELLDVTTCRCGDYANRRRQVPDCVQITPAVLQKPAWLPETCAYRRLAEGRRLPDWHPLLTGDPSSTIEAGQSVSGRAIRPTRGTDPLMHLIDWIR